MCVGRARSRVDLAMETRTRGGRAGDQTALSLGARGLHTGRPALPRARPAVLCSDPDVLPPAPVVAFPRRPRAA